MKKVLILGGTGAMGKALVELLDVNEYEIYVTSRKQHKSERVTYLCGNAHELSFLSNILELQEWDSIVDFMNYQTSEFETIVSKILPRTKQYIFISSARVYAPSDTLLCEDSPRLLDVCTDVEYVSSNEYALAKAREENLLFNSTYKNWTIVRPSLTYNDNRLQFALWDKEGWLYRALCGKSIVFPKNMMDVKTTMSHGMDVSRAIARLMCNEKALGEVVHIAGAKALTWGEVLQIYRDAVKKCTGKDIGVHYVDDWQELSHSLGNYYQAKYARAISREFHSDKLFEIVGEMSFISPEKGLTECIEKFTADGCKYHKISWRSEAVLDRITGENSLREFYSIKDRTGYIITRWFPFLLKILGR